MSGRRRSISAGTPTATFAGAFGISLGPASKRVDGPGRLPEERAQGVARLLEPGRELGDRGPGALQQGRRLGRIELRGRPVPEARLGDLQRLLLNLDVLLGLLDQHLEGADDDVGARDLGGERDEGRVVVGDRPEQGGGLRFHAPPVLAPEVQLPGGVEAQLIGPRIAREVGDVDDVLAEPHRGRAAGEPACIWGNCLPVTTPELGAGLDDSQAGDLQRQVLPVGELDQAIERRVVERLPPQAVGGGLRRDARVTSRAPALVDGRPRAS